MGWTMLYLFVFLKLPIVAACWIVWWAVHQETDGVEEGGDGGGGRRARPHPVPKRPRPPRRGPHGEAEPPSPPRIRSVTAAGRERSLGH
jgi:hypothetical protein